MAEVIFWSSIIPKQLTRPISCYQLAHHLRKNNITCQVIDFCGWFSKEELFNLTEKFIDKETKILGISTVFWRDDAIPLFLNYLNEFKEKYPAIEIVFGGPRANNINFEKYYDKIFLGEAENQLVEYLYELKKLDKSKIIKFDITKLDHRFIHEDCIVDGEVLPIELGRGCIFKCKFCSHHNLGKPKKTYQRSYKFIEEELRYNLGEFNVTHYNFLDDTVNEDLEKIIALKEINEKLDYKIKWNGYLRADLIWSHNNSATFLEESGLATCFFGIETFNEKAAMTIGKGWNGKKAKNYIPELYNNIWKSKINIWNNFIIGLPYENLESLESTLDWCKNNNIGYNKFNVLNLYLQRTDNGVKSEFTKNFKKFGYIVDESKFWRNDFFTHQEALELNKSFNKELIPYNRLSSWSLFDMYNITRRNLNDLKNQLQNNFLLGSGVIIFLSNYKNKLRSL